MILVLLLDFFFFFLHETEISKIVQGHMHTHMQMQYAAYPTDHCRVCTQAQQKSGDFQAIGPVNALSGV